MATNSLRKVLGVKTSPYKKYEDGSTEKAPVLRMAKTKGMQPATGSGFEDSLKNGVQDAGKLPTKGRELASMLQGSKRTKRTLK